MRAYVSCLACSFAFGVLGQTVNLYENHFETNAIGQTPAELLVLDGGFAVREENGNKFLELPGSPLDSFAVQFGPAEAEDVALAARIKGTATGKRYPTFGIGLNGTAGYKLQVSPAKKQLEIYQDQEPKAAIPYEWKANQWTQLRLQVRKDMGQQWKIEGKAWPEGGREPQGWSISIETKVAPIAGKASVFGSPFSGKPIQFDDLVFSRIKSNPR